MKINSIIFNNILLLTATFVISCGGNRNISKNNEGNISENNSFVEESISENDSFIKESISENISFLAEARNNVIKNKSDNFYFNQASEYVRNEGEASWNAIANFEMAISVNPSNGGYYNDIANCYRGGIKNYKKALEYYNKAIENGYDEGFIYYNRAICKFETNDLTGACSDYSIAKSSGWQDDYYDIATKAKCTIKINQSNGASLNQTQVTNIDGVYYGSQNISGLNLTAKLIISGSRWSVSSQLGYDNPEYQNGVVMGSDLYDDSGMIKIGYVSGNSANIDGYPSMRK